MWLEKKVSVRYHRDRGNGEEAGDTGDLQAEPGDSADAIKCYRGKTKTKGDTGFGDERLTRDLYKSSCSETF